MKTEVIEISEKQTLYISEDGFDVYEERLK